jgi:uncharacterized protein (DUF1800 family)
MIKVGNMPEERRALHALNRLAFGPRPGDVERVRQIGVDRYIHEQLDPKSIPEPPELARQVAALRTLQMTPVELFAEFQLPVMRARGDQQAQKEARQRSRVIIQEAIEGRLIRAIYGPRQLQEVMTAFWYNHFNVFAGKGLCHLWVGAYEQEAVRPHTMGPFETLLLATAKHPAMLFYLDNWQNTGPDSPGRRGPFEGINENFAREVMELHTLGVGGGYTQADVTSLAHIMTGWGLRKLRKDAGVGMRMGAGRMGRMAGWRLWRPGRQSPSSGARDDPYGFYFDPDRHDFSDQIFLARTYRGAAGMGEGEQAFEVLAHCQATARHLSYQLAQYFVADEPPAPLVARTAERFERSRGDIRAALETLFFSPEFWDERYYGAKFKTPYDYVVSAARLAGVSEITNYRPLFGAMAILGMPPYGHETPDGYKNTREAWLNPDGMMTRLSFAAALGQGHLPLLAPPFNEGGGVPFRVNFKRGGAEGAITREINSGPKMQPLETGQLLAALGPGALSANTREAIEAAPAGLRSALVLGSPEFMVR